MAKKTKIPGSLTTKHWLGYMFGDFGGCMTFALMSSVVTRYYTNVLRVNSFVLFILIMVWNIWDAINDPMMGAIMDKMFAKSKNPKGKFRPWLLRSTPLLAVTAMAFWTLPTFFDGITMVVVLFACKVAYEACYTMFNIPMGSLLSAMSSNDQERASLSSARGVGSMLGNGIPMMAAPAILAYFGDNNPQGYRVVGVCCAAIGFVLCLLHYYLTEERNAGNSDNIDETIKTTDIIQVFKYNRPFVALCIHGVCICAMQSMFNSIGTYMYGDVYGNLELMEMTYIASAPAMILIFAMAPWISKKIGLEKMIRYSSLIGSIAFVVLFIVMMTFDISPVVFMILSAIAMGIPTVSIQMQWGLVAEAIDYNEVVIGKKTEGSIYGTFNLARRIGGAIGQGAVVLALPLIGYSAELSDLKLPQPDSAVLGIKILNVLIPAFFVLGSWIAFKYVWNITPEKRVEMAAKKAAVSVESDTCVEE